MCRSATASVRDSSSQTACPASSHTPGSSSSRLRSIFYFAPPLVIEALHGLLGIFHEQGLLDFRRIHRKGQRRHLRDMPEAHGLPGLPGEKILCAPSVDE